MYLLFREEHCEASSLSILEQVVRFCTTFKRSVTQSALHLKDYDNDNSIKVI